MSKIGERDERERNKERWKRKNKKEKERRERKKGWGGCKYHSSKSNQTMTLKPLPGIPIQGVTQ